MDYAYYTCAARVRSGRRAAQHFAATYRGLLDRRQPADPGAVEDLVMAHRLGDLPRISFETLARPFDGRTFSDPARFRRRLVKVLRHDIAESEKETTASPLKAALETLRALRPALPSVVDFVGCCRFRTVISSPGGRR